MATFEVKGIDEYGAFLRALDLNLRDTVISKAVYEGCAILADEIKSEIENLPTDCGTGSQEDPLVGPNPVQKHFLIESMGVSPMKEENGVVHARIGFDGYNPIKTKRWPQGQPNAMIAASVERGTSILKANPFMKRAVQRCKNRVIGVMGNTVDAEIKKIMDK